MIIFLTVYVVLLLAFQLGWQRAVQDRKRTMVSFYPMISVVVPVRNEQENILSLLDDLRHQDYANYEVILVNDHSSDNTLGKAEQHKFANVTIVQNQGAGKKSAIRTGIALAKGEIIATTDADCRHGKHWLECIQRTFVSDDVKFVFGAVSIQPDKSFFSKLQAVEFSSLIGSGAATSALEFPTMCNGANLAFRKDSFEKVNGYEGNEHIASGDDEFLMRKMKATFPDGIKFIPYRDGTVRTNPEHSLVTFINQRLRWAGKWKHNTSVATVILALFIFAMQAAVLTGIISLVHSFDYSILILLFVKFVLEGSFIHRVCRFCGIRMSWIAFLSLQFLYPFYVIAIGFFSNFVDPVWKGRRVGVESTNQKV